MIRLLGGIELVNFNEHVIMVLSKEKAYISIEAGN